MYLRSFRPFLFLFFISLSFSLLSQKGSQANERLAEQYLNQKEYGKAALYLEELYDKDPRWFTSYYKCLIETREYSKAEKITKKQLKNSRNEAHLYVLLGRVYRLQGEEKRERDAYDKALKELVPVQPYIQQLANAFIEEKLFDQAIAVYDKARKATPEYPYYYERAEVYKAKNDLQAMVNEYLDALEFRESELLTVQSNLQNSLGYDDEEGGMKNPLLRQELQKRIQKNPGKIVLTEFLIFIQKQQKDFDGAFVQSRALDKRLKEEGQRIYELARICVSNEDWSAAKRCYDYLLEKGQSGAYYDLAVTEGLHVEYLSLTSQAQPPVADLMKLEQKLAEANTRYSQTFLNVQILKDLCHVKAYYLGKAAEASGLLDAFIGRPGIDVLTKAEFKLLLADIYLIKGEIWEASLLYSQVEKDFKYEAIGQEAKFRNAKLSFYAGDFAWSKSQADVLKGATSKLIANDALDLSLVITDAIGVDTNDVPLKLYASAELMILQHRYNEAIARMDSVNLLFSANTLGDDIYFRKAGIYRSLGKFTEAEAMYKNVLEYYPDDLYGDDAQFRLAELYERDLKDNSKARSAYEDVLTKYPGSIFTVEARKRFRLLRGDQVTN